MPLLLRLMFFQQGPDPEGRRRNQDLSARIAQLEGELSDTLILLADEKRGIAIPPKGVFDAMAKRIFEEESE